MGTGDQNSGHLGWLDFTSLLSQGSFFLTLRYHMLFKNVVATSKFHRRQNDPALPHHSRWDDPSPEKARICSKPHSKSTAEPPQNPGTCWQNGRLSTTAPAFSGPRKRGRLGRGPSRPLSRAAPQLSSGSACFTCSYHHCVVLGLRASLGFPVSLSPSSAGRGTQGPAEPSATCSHFCLVLDQ